MSTIESKWKYYLPDADETTEDASYISHYDWQHISAAEAAASFAAEDEWDQRDGRERGFGDIIRIVVVSPDGVETAFRCEAEADVHHYVREVE